VSTPESQPAADERSFRTMMLGIAGSMPLIGFAVWGSLGLSGLGEFPASWALLVPLAVGVGAYSYCELRGFRAKPVQPGGDPKEVGPASRRSFNDSTFRRSVACELPFLVTVPIDYITTSFWPSLIGLLIALPLFFWMTWPSTRNEQRFAAALESGGHPSYLLGRPQDL
jgi:hypothetical protein